MVEEVNTQSDEALFERRRAALLDKLPGRIARGAHWLLRPPLWWIRIPAGVLLCVGGVLSFLPVLGLWMLPLGLALLAEDVPFCRSLSARLLGYVARKLPAWVGE